MTAQRIALLGGTFDPVHLGHLLLAVHSFEALNLDRLIFVPTRLPVHKDTPAAAPAERLEMVRLAIGQDDRFLVCDCELTRNQPSYSIDTARQFQNKLASNSKLFWIIGSDMLADLPSWHKVRDFLDAIELIVVARPGQSPPDFSALKPALTDNQINKIKAHAIDLPLIEISSTQIRKRIADKRSVRYFLPRAVEQCIMERQLYR